MVAYIAQNGTECWRRNRPGVCFFVGFCVVDGVGGVGVGVGVLVITSALRRDLAGGRKAGSKPSVE